MERDQSPDKGVPHNTNTLCSPRNHPAQIPQNISNCLLLDKYYQSDPPGLKDESTKHPYKWIAAGRHYLRDHLLMTESYRTIPTTKLLVKTKNITTLLVFFGHTRQGPEKMIPFNENQSPSTATEWASEMGNSSFEYILREYCTKYNSPKICCQAPVHNCDHNRIV